MALHGDHRRRMSLVHLAHVQGTADCRLGTRRLLLVSETAKQRQPVLCIAVTTVEHEVVVAEHVTHHVHFRLISERCVVRDSQLPFHLV